MEKAGEILGNIGMKATQANGAYVKELTQIGDIECCTIKVHRQGNAFASFSQAWRLNGKRIAYGRLLEKLSAC